MARKKKEVTVEPEAPVAPTASTMPAILRTFNIGFLRKYGPKTLLFIQKLISQKETEFLSEDGRRILVQIDFNAIAVNRWKREEKYRTYVWSEYSKIRGNKTPNETHHVYIIPRDAEIKITSENKFDHSINRIQASLDACKAELLMTVQVDDLTGTIVAPKA
jgi:hypothetical protein